MALLSPWNTPNVCRRDHHASKRRVKTSSSLCSQGRTCGPWAKGEATPTESLEDWSQRYRAKVRPLTKQGTMQTPQWLHDQCASLEMVLAHWGPSRVVQHRAPSLNGAHPQRLEVPPIRLAAPEGGGGEWLDAQKLGRTSLSLSCTGMLKVPWTRRLNWSTSYMRKTSTFAASRRRIFSPANTSRWGAISASGQTEQTEAKEEYWLLSETTSMPVW